MALSRGAVESESVDTPSLEQYRFHPTMLMFKKVCTVRNLSREIVDV